MTTSISRRRFLRSSAVAAGTFLIAKNIRAAAANEKLNIGVIGVTGRGAQNLTGIKAQNIVALCDVDSDHLATAAKDFPKAKLYADFRLMLEQKDMDAVLVSTPDHTHAVATMAVLKSGRPVYCEKPLTHTISEARILSELAKKSKLATQMGTQIHAGDNYRRVVELIQGGAIGSVGEVHVWVDSPWEAKDRPEGTPPPANINWDLWLGPAQVRPYSAEYAPFNWRRWWDFGGGTLGDFGCHHIDLSHWALNLRQPVSVETEGSPIHPECVPLKLIVRYQYPARGAMPPVKLTWYQNGERPHHFKDGVLPTWGKMGTLFVGEKGMLIADYTKHTLLPEKDFAGFRSPPKTIPTSVGHHEEWIRACKTGSPTTCNFDYGCALTETVLLGNVAHRVGKRLEWNSELLKATNCPEADQYIQHHYREGWSI